MKNLIRSTVLSLCFAIACMAYGAVPQLNVTVSDAGGKAAFKGTTDRSGAFTTAKLKPGSYIVQLSSPSGGVQGNYAIVVAAGVKKVSASAVAGEKFAKGGVALKLDVANLLNIVGQVTADTGGGAPMGSNGKPMVWIPKQLGSHKSAHWAESDSAEAKEAQTAGSMSTRDIQNRQDRGISPGG